MAIYFIEYQAYPELTHSRAGEIGGAFICCWVESDGIESARSRCQRELKVEAWLLISEERAFLADRASLEGNEESIAMYDQAAIEGFCCTIHSWPNEPQDGEGIH